MAGKPKYDDPETEYVQSVDKISIRALAKKWDIPQGTIATRSQSQKWKQKRDEYWAAVYKVTKEKGAERHAKNADGIKSQIEDTLSMLGHLIHDSVSSLRGNNLSTIVNNPDKESDSGAQLIKAKAAFETLKCAKIATEAINNLDERVNEIYGLSKEGDGVTPEDIAALVRLASSSGTDSPPGRILPN